MFTTNAVQAGSVPTLQYQEHPQKSQGKNIENAQQKTQQSQPQQEFPTFCYTTNVNMIGKIGTGTTGDNNITVVATGVGSSNEVTMPPHIQILATDPNEQQQHHVQIQDTKPVIIDKSQSKCITCGGPLANNPKRKGPKLIRCENCIAQDTVDQRVNSTQIFVSGENNVKFEVGGVSGVQTQNDPLTSAPPAQQPQQQKTIQAGHHPVKKRNLASVTKCQNCNGSGIVFIGGNKNKNSTSNSEKPFHCNICGGSFSRYSSLWSHKKLHSGEKNFKCGVCGIAFAKAVYLKNHSRIHTGEKPYSRNSASPRNEILKVCDKGFARHATLWNHRRIHTGEKPYKCETCGSAFSQAAHLKNHAKVHSGEKPFKCDICTAAFADRFALKRHRGIHDKYGQTTPMMVASRIQLPEPDELEQQQNSDQQNSQSEVELRSQTAL
ncbi:jg26789 [Pararge aegeria aegeria]|uniref:Jg26789 protein n=1 Tax=Pararge aegeria aegeria TaxID=348720 RepID=A0A8S4SE97_9NEOP|nr:jg26789 [Pararge aegeria aegeria]